MSISYASSVYGTSIFDAIGVLNVNVVAKGDVLTKVGFQQRLQIFRSMFPKQQKQPPDAKRPTIDVWAASKKGPSRGGCRTKAGEEEV